MRFIIIILLLSFSKFTSAQITFDDLLKIQRSDVGTITSLLMDKDWQLVSSSEETDEKYGNMAWGYKISEYDAEKALAWLDINYSEKTHNRISLQVFNKAMYIRIKDKVMSYGMKKVNYGLSDGFSFNDYAGVNYVVRIGASSNSESNISRYTFKVWSKADYINFMTDKYESDN